jgi:hypothetical protein
MSGRSAQARLCSGWVTDRWHLRGSLRRGVPRTWHQFHRSSLIVRWLTPSAVAIRSMVHSREVLGYPPAVIMLDGAAGH